MLTTISPKLPSRNLDLTAAFYIQKLGFELVSRYDSYLIVRRDHVEIHFFPFATLDFHTNYGQVYIRLTDIETLYTEWSKQTDVIHPNGALAQKPWGQKEFSVLDPDHNLLTFGEAK
jgi:catechol 2,3-dioxygenase-like lactoylglutathione lyase family enzyme